MSFAVANGYPIFTDAWGKPLSDGYIFIGEKGLNPLSNPQAVYWDEALSIPATNIRTTGGYAMKDGSPGQLFTERPYSILVQNKNGATVFYQPDGAEDEEGKDVVFSTAGQEYLLPSSASVGDRLSFVVKNEAPDAKITQPDGVTIIRGLSQRTVTGPTGRFVTRPGQSLRVTNVGESYVFTGEFPSAAGFPSSPPANFGFDNAWSPDSRYHVVTQNVPLEVFIYDWSSGSAVLMPSLADPPVGVCNGVAWSPDGQRLSFAHDTSPYVTTYDWNDGTPIKLADAATLPTGDGNGIAWSPDGRYLSVAHATSPFITIYDWDSGSPVKIADPAALPTLVALSAAWSLNGRYLAVGHSGPPFFTVYDWSSGSPVKVTEPASDPGGAGYGVSWSPNGRYLAVAHATSPYITIYDWSSGLPVKISDPADLPTNIGRSVTWSPEGRYLAVGHDGDAFGDGPFLTVYDWEYGVPIKDTALGEPISGSGRSVAWSPNGKYLAVTSTVTPFLAVLDTADELSDAWMLQHVDGPEIQDSDFDNRTP